MDAEPVRMLSIFTAKWLSDIQRVTSTKELVKPENIWQLLNYEFVH